MKRQNIRTLSLVIVTLTYLIIGAAVFDYCESGYEYDTHNMLETNTTHFKARYNMNKTEFDRLWRLMLDKRPFRAGRQWRFIGSLYFCTLVVSLIGYGHSTPRTVAGKSFCIIYTLVGIPIALIMFQSVGERLNSLISFIIGRVKKRIKTKKTEVSIPELITIELVLCITITTFASYIFANHEGWSYFDCIYYCFITLTTIG
jgi:hypothetical protein